MIQSTLEEHERKFMKENTLIDRLREANLKLQLDKCEFFKTEVNLFNLFKTHN